ncbi:MAG: sigma 54-interacting transcriptional regulator, partial [Acidobacteriota bacterium]
MPRSDSELHRNLEASTVNESLSTEAVGDPQVPGLTILWHSDPARVGHWAPLAPLGSGRGVSLSRGEPRFVDPEGGEPLPLAERHVSRRPIRLEPGSAPGAVQVLGGGPKTVLRPAGRVVPGGVELEAEQIVDGVVLELAERVALVLHLMPAVRARPPRFGLVGESASILQLRQDLLRVADLDVPVLLRGETGTGKELVARALHRASRRRAGACLSVNVGAIPPTLAAAELFGSARGAFTGADRRREGYFVQASGGTLFLDEIGECPPDVQVLLLRALESGEVQPVGAERPRGVDVRVLAATDADLEAAIDEGRFRAPLLHRLNGYSLQLPALRERRDDVGRLLLHFLRLELGAMGESHRLTAAGPRDPMWLPASLVGRLARCRWPGNVRQLRNLARQLVIGHRGSERIVVDSRVSALLREVEGEDPVSSPSGAVEPVSKPKYRHPSEVGEGELRRALEDHAWQLKAAAAALGVSRTSLYTLIER